jgi:hypothetical protein
MGLLALGAVFLERTNGSEGQAQSKVVRATQNKFAERFGPEDSVDSDCAGPCSLVVLVNSKTGMGLVAHHGYIDRAESEIIGLLKFAKSELGLLEDLEVYVSGASDRYVADVKTLARRDFFYRQLLAEGFADQQIHFAWLPPDHLGQIAGVPATASGARFQVHYWSRHQQWRLDALQVTRVNFDSSILDPQCSWTLAALQ